MNKYPSTWKRDYFASPYNQGRLTRKASEWAKQIKGLTMRNIKQGIDNLVNRDEKVWPPNAMEFRNLCVVSDFENVLDAIICRIQDGENHKWTNQLAFNVWMTVSSDFLSAQLYQVPKLIKHRLRVIDKTSMFPLPDYEVKAIEKPKVPTAADKDLEKIKRRFLGVLTTVVTYLNIPMPDIFEQKLIANKGGEIVQEFQDKGFIIPDLPEQNQLSDKDFKLKKEQCRLVYQSAVKQFVMGLS